MKYLYGFTTEYYYGLQIKKYEIESETKGQYIIKGCVVRRVFKSNMTTYNYHFYLTEDGAKKGMLDHCQQSIASCERTIENMKQKINYYNSIAHSIGNNEKGGK